MRAFLGLFLLLTAQCFASSTSQIIDEILSKVDPNVHVGIEIVSLDTGEVLYQKNASCLFVPASCAKIFTAGIALGFLGSDFTYETSVLVGPDDNLYLKGTGDPEFSHKDLETLSHTLSLQGLREVDNLFIDNSDFDSVAMGPGWMWDEGAVFWNSPLDALMVNHSCIDVWVRPSKNCKPPFVSAFPKTNLVQIRNLAITQDPGDQFEVARRWKTKEDVIEVTGHLSPRSPLKQYKIPLEDPAVFTGNLFKEFLAKDNIFIKGAVKLKKTAKGAKIAALHKSRPLSHMLAAVLKESDNLPSDALFKKIGEKKFGGPGSWKKGQGAIRSFLAENVGMDISDFVLLDGSGLSRYNLVSPHHLVSFLSWTHKQFSISSEFMSALSLSGIDGTLQERMLDIKGKVRAKTGSMTGISSICGYVSTKDGELLSFAILMNGSAKPTDSFREEIEDRICSYLASFSRTK